MAKEKNYTPGPWKVSSPRGYLVELEDFVRLMRGTPNLEDLEALTRKAKKVIKGAL